MYGMNGSVTLTSAINGRQQTFFHPGNFRVIACGGFAATFYVDADEMMWEDAPGEYTVVMDH
jgi:hypothetical protein